MMNNLLSNSIPIRKSSRAEEAGSTSSSEAETWQSSQEIVEEYEEEYSPEVVDNRVFAANYKPPPRSEPLKNDFGVVHKPPPPPAKDTRVFAANYRPPKESVVGREAHTHLQRQFSSEIDQSIQSQEASKMTMYQDQYQQQKYQQYLENQRLQQQQQQYEEQWQRQQIEEQKRRQLEEQHQRHIELERARLEEERKSQSSPLQREGEPPRLNLHQGSVVQFPSKLPDPKHKLPDGSHLEEEKNRILLRQATVVQFPSNLPDPNQKHPEGSHLGEEKKKVHLHEGTVCQFPSEVPDYSHKLPEAPHMRDLEELEHLQLKQGSVVQFPKEIHETKFEGFHPPKEALTEELPPAETTRYNHLLPSEARRQQAYLLHQNQQPIRLLSEVSSAPGSPSFGRRNQQWPPQRYDTSKYNSFIIPEGGKKSFIWPPPKPEFHRSFQELPPPEAGHGPAADIWHPQESVAPRSYRQPLIHRKKANWPPPTPMRKQTSLPEMNRRKNIEFEEHFLYHAGVNVPQCYHTPPGTQFYNPYD
ncbi:hypothetical protein B4U79_09689 [Dinothrombium tinctorium]|uniref:Uncharacterized protein n=1 Tax=Dinothrombium tinctorium TaxID=1965070 RepID=A0A443R1V0_9ACAR|nr:hypothetical protein B4U79_09689 [Dinothrombium tinctorium]